jgi:5-formyltetrahydrofolate cyclo-ligase
MPALEKKIMRQVMKERRALLFQQHPNVGEQLADFFTDAFDLPLQTVIGGYWPMGNELDIKPLLYKLIAKKFPCALPCLTSEGLSFRSWTPSTRLEAGDFGIQMPPLTAPVVFPTLLFVPLLAFDKSGNRLGYGQGHYDRYLHHHPSLTIGVGFKGQEVENIPHQSHDFPLDYVLTEGGLIKIKNFQQALV